MGNYASSSDLKARFEDDTEVAYLTNTAASGTPDEDVITECINYAEGLIDSHVGMRYAIPVTVSSDAVLAAMLKSAALDLAVYHLRQRGDVMPTTAKDAHDKVMAWLDRISKGEVLLPSAATIASTASREPMVLYGTAGTGDDSNRLFSRATQENI